MKTIKITKVVPVEGAVITKITNAYGRSSFDLPIEYYLADGRIITAAVRCKRKKDVMESLKSKGELITAGAMKANFDDDGKYCGTSYVISLAPTLSGFKKAVGP